MAKVAKLVIIDDQDKYLILYRNNHPRFGNDADLPGGTLEFGEKPVDAMVREVDEEAGVTISKDNVELIYSGTEYSHHFVQYNLFVTKLDTRPDITISWEHISYDWVGRDEFLAIAKGAKDSFMHMTYQTLKDRKV